MMKKLLAMFSAMAFALIFAVNTVGYAAAVDIEADWKLTECSNAGYVGTVITIFDNSGTWGAHPVKWTPAFPVTAEFDMCMMDGVLKDNTLTAKFTDVPVTGTVSADGNQITLNSDDAAAPLKVVLQKVK